MNQRKWRRRGLFSCLCTGINFSYTCLHLLGAICLWPNTWHCVLLWIWCNGLFICLLYNKLRIFINSWNRHLSLQQSPLYFQSIHTAEAGDVRLPFNCCRNSAMWAGPIRQQPPNGQRGDSLEKILKEKKKKQGKNWRQKKRKQFISPIKAAPCFIHVWLSLGIDADVFPDVNHLCRKKETMCLCALEKA